MCTNSSDCGGAERGACVDGVCQCYAGWTGDECDIVDSWACTNASDCGGGQCVEGTCQCYEGYFGDACEQFFQCPNHSSPIQPGPVVSFADWVERLVLGVSRGILPRF
ncbi:hypothetical protein T484DRAFT_1800164 [Baffinella frigidus]|nr:hypothetical protein T484DRAFT_1800164 [Cryptophyta sp. CCMP2293]